MICEFLYIYIIYAYLCVFNMEILPDKGCCKVRYIQSIYNFYVLIHFIYEMMENKNI